MGRRSVDLDEHDERVGRYIRDVRKRRQLTLVALSERSGLSHPFLSQVERGKARPSRGSLELIAEALGSSPAEITAAAQRPETSGDGGGQREAHGRSRVLLQQQAAFSVIEITYTDQTEQRFYAHPEPELFYIVRGTAVVELGDERARTYEAGDSVFCPPDTGHRWRAVDEAGFTALLVKDDPLK